MVRFRLDPVDEARVKPRRLPPLLLAAPLLMLAACTATAPPSALERDAVTRTPAELARAAGVALTTAPRGEVNAQWKERLSQPYVFLEHRGARRDFGQTMRRLLELARRAGVGSGGSPFGLFDERAPSRACLPVAAPPEKAALSYDVLPAAMVAYAVVTGAYPEVPRSYAGIEDWMAGRGWSRRGAVREVYLVNPAEVADYADLATEVQIAWAITQ